ncbi:hypothetical protein cyc_03657 [Cyclospora cayetanensis]|uniref:Uncharacterized protein n=1 Tax=Cyclospora cayetanensis TaxID=88456 RepID=A0A1D3D0M5_9EIME|nr:hypothetical protein cyc_03657 [Cyclospora cayetanensis]
MDRCKQKATSSISACKERREWREERSKRLPKEQDERNRLATPRAPEPHAACDRFTETHPEKGTQRKQ